MLTHSQEVPLKPVQKRAVARAVARRRQREQQQLEDSQKLHQQAEDQPERQKQELHPPQAEQHQQPGHKAEEDPTGAASSPPRLEGMQGSREGGGEVRCAAARSGERASSGAVAAAEPIRAPAGAVAPWETDCSAVQEALTALRCFVRGRSGRGGEGGPGVGDDDGLGGEGGEEGGGGTERGMRGGALWDIFRREDAGRLRDYVRRHAREFTHLENKPLEQVRGGSHLERTQSTSSLVPGMAGCARSFPSSVHLIGWLCCLASLQSPLPFLHLPRVPQLCNACCACTRCGLVCR